MIKLTNINKTYNKGRRNELRVLQDINLEFAATGLVCLLGPSGSGKSTLLNVIGGLDRADEGRINFQDVEIRKYVASKWDNIRSGNIGYIFQNYILLPDLTVYENVKKTLQLVNTPPEEIEERIEYCLKAVRMEKFKKRKARNLSGGEQQRVAIARALVTSPNVIIADEPTGNLDSNNSTQILNIIKNISKECLVILVTHDEHLAQFYADRIIRLHDGKIISDEENTPVVELDDTSDQNIYLKEFSSDNLIHDKLAIKYFYQGETPALDLQVIYRDNTFYLKSTNPETKIKLLDSSDEIKVIDSKRPVISQEEVSVFSYHLPKLTTRKQNVFAFRSFYSLIKESISRMKSLKRFQKLMLFGLMGIAILFVVFSSSLLGLVTNVGAVDIDVDKNLYGVDLNTKNFESLATTVDEFYSYKEKGYYDFYANAANVGPFELIYDKYLQVPLNVPMHTLFFTGYLASLNLVTEQNIIVGRMPQTSNEFILDQLFVDELLASFQFAQVGMNSYIDLVDAEVIFNYREKYKIVGIANTGAKNIYMNLESIYKALFETVTTWTDDDSITTSYHQQLQDNEYLVNTQNRDSNTQSLLDNLGFKKVGTFTSDKEYQTYVVSSVGLEKLALAHYLEYDDLSFYAHDKNQTFKNFSNNKLFTVYNHYDQQLAEYKKNNALQLARQLIYAVVVISITLLLLGFVIRANMISQIYEIGALRSLGVKKRSIYASFIVEISVITMMTSFFGWLITSYILNSSRTLFSELGIYYSWPIAFVIFILIWLLNVIIGLVPVFVLLKKTPAEIGAKYDI